MRLMAQSLPADHKKHGDWRFPIFAAVSASTDINSNLHGNLV